MDTCPDGSPLETHSNSTNKDLLFVDFPEIPDILYHPCAVNSPAAWIRFNAEKLDKSRHQTSQLHAARGDNPSPYRCLQPPTCLSDPIFASHERPEVMFQRMLKDESAKITYMESTWFAPGFTWNEEFLETAYIFIPERQKRSPAEVLGQLLGHHRDGMETPEHGLKFHLALPQDCLRQFQPIIVDSLDHTSASSLYAIRFQEPNLSPAENAATFCTLYQARMNDLLCCPHARAFIGEGGQLSWIARCWTGLRLVEDFMSGPSIQVMVHNRGFYDKRRTYSSITAQVQMAAWDNGYSCQWIFSRTILNFGLENGTQCWITSIESSLTISPEGKVSFAQGFHRRHGRDHAGRTATHLA